MSKILNFGLGAAAAALTTGLGMASAYAAYTPPVLGSPQQNMGVVAAGPGLLVSHNAPGSSAVMSVLVKNATGTVYNIQAFIATSIAYAHFYAGVTAAPTCSLTSVSAMVQLPIGNDRIIMNDQYGVGFSGGVGLCVSGGSADGNTTALGSTTDIVDVYYR